MAERRRRDRSEKRKPEPEPEPKKAPEPPRSRLAWLVFAALAAIVAIVVVTRVTGDEHAESEESAGEGARLGGRDDRSPEHLRVRVIHRYPHSTDAFTQGLLWHGGYLYESTGLR